MGSILYLGAIFFGVLAIGALFSEGPEHRKNISDVTTFIFMAGLLVTLAMLLSSFDAYKQNNRDESPTIPIGTTNVA